MSNESPQRSQWHTPTEIARLLNVEERSILGIIKKKQLCATRVEGEWRVSPSSLNQFLSRNSNVGKKGKWHIIKSGRILIAVSFLCVLLLASAMLHAENDEELSDPSTISYQGYLEHEGKPQDGDVRLIFTIEDPAGKILDWSETHNTIVKSGHFSVQLGDIQSLDDFLNRPMLYLRIAVQQVNKDNGQPIGSPAVLSGRQLLASVPYARRATPGKPFTIDGDLELGGGINMDDGEFIKADGRLNITSAQGLYLLSQGGTVHVSKEFGGDGNFTVDGTTTTSESIVTGNASVSGNLVVSGSINTGCEMKVCKNLGDWGECTCPSGKTIQTGGCHSPGSPYVFQASYPMSLTTWGCGGHGGGKTIYLICCRQY